jgi:CRISPR-associated exonuclease Cas4
MSNEKINISMLNEYLYCPRRYWYIIFYDTQGDNYYRKDGTLKHEAQSTRGGWTKEIYLESEKLQAKGKIDILEDNENKPVERKRGDKYYTNDEIQLAGYCMLLEENTGRKIEKGTIYMFKTDQRHEIEISKWHREKVKETIKEMRNLNPDNPPPIIDNRNKCKGCSARSYCMPEETEKLGEDGQGNLIEEES